MLPTITSRSGLPATSILRLSPSRPVTPDRATRGADTVIAAVQFPPRTAQVLPLGQLLPQVLAAYGIAASADMSGSTASFDAVA
jgi:hypothetical protein